jgi:hypothetical protein
MTLLEQPQVQPDWTVKVSDGWKIAFENSPKWPTGGSGR